MKEWRIPFNRSALLGREQEYIAQAMRIGQIGGDQSFTRKCQALLETVLTVPRVLLTTSCTHALEMCAFLLRIEPEDEVIVPSYTFVSTANAFALRGARPVFADIRADTLNIDESKLQALITSKTKAIVVVHYAGVGCEMDSILEIARRHEIPVVEDNAHGLFGKYRGSHLGTFGCLATQSFHETKNITCGEGGALIINDPGLVEHAEIIREKGTDRARFFRGQIDKYTWRDLGSSYVMSDVLAAFLYGQLESWKQVQSSRRSIWEYYDSRLEEWAQRNGIRRPTVPRHCEQAFHTYYLVLPTPEARQSLMQHLAEQGILAVFHYLPLHLSKMGAKFGARFGDCPVSESVSERLLRLPFFNDMTESQRDSIVSALLDWSHR
jgi:dTDP-4-amino-4,6-dideoxygalactose transaminase